MGALRTAAAILGLVTLTAALPACGEDEAPSQPESSGPLVVYQRSGGVAGLVEELRIEPDGRAALSVGVDRERSSFELDGDELARLETELEAADFDAIEAPPGEPICADCFGYEIEYAGSTVELDDLDRPPDSVATVLAHLGELVADNYPPNASGRGAGG